MHTILTVARFTCSLFLFLTGSALLIAALFLALNLDGGILMPKGTTRTEEFLAALLMVHLGLHLCDLGEGL